MSGCRRFHYKPYLHNLNEDTQHVPLKHDVYTFLASQSHVWLNSLVVLMKHLYENEFHTTNDFKDLQFHTRVFIIHEDTCDPVNTEQSYDVQSVLEVVKSSTHPFS
jgi:hypothetical protein